MIDILFEFGPDVILVKIEGNSIKMGSTAYGSVMASIEGLKLNKGGVEKEFPDLKEDLLWKEKAIQRFTDKIKSLGAEDKIADYIIKDLSQHGYIPRKMQVGGHRPIKL